MFYVVASATLLFFYFRETHKSDSQQKIPADWSFRAKSLVREGVNHELEDRFEMALRSYQFAIDALTKKEGGSEGTNEKNKEDNMISLDSKSPEWLTGYADLLARTGRILELLEQSDEARAAFQASFSNPWGSGALKSVAAIQLAKYEQADGNLEAAEEYFVEGVKAVASTGMAKLFKEGDVKNAVLIQDSSKGEQKEQEKKGTDNVSIQLYNATIELGKFYASTGRFPESLQVLLATLRSVKQKREPQGRDLKRVPDSNCFEARIMAYISEVLWATGKKQDAVIWVESSYFEAYPLSSSTVECGLCAQMAMENAAKMYKVSCVLFMSNSFEASCFTN